MTPFVAFGYRKTKTDKQTYVKPEDDWIRIEKNHEPLVSDRDFEIVQRLLGMDTRTSPDQKQVSKTSFISKRSLQVNRSVRKNNAFFSL